MAQTSSPGHRGLPTAAKNAWHLHFPHKDHDTDHGCSVAPMSLVDLDRLHGIAGEEQLDDPVDQHAHFALQSGQLGQIDARHIIQANKPEKRTLLFAKAESSAHAVWWPTTHSVPSPSKWKGLSAFPWTLAWMLWASVRASRRANWAVGGQGSPVFASVTAAQSPTAHRPAWPGTARFCRPARAPRLSCSTGRS